MAILPIKLCHNRIRGLTLIEVLIALAIISIALTAIIKATSHSIRGTTYLQTKTIATWVGQQTLNEARAGVLKLPNPPDTLNQTTTMLNQDWHWQAREEATPNRHIRKIVVEVYDREPTDDTTPIITLESYVYHAE